MKTTNQFEKPPVDLQSEKILSPEEFREKMRDPSYLPTHADVRRAFRVERQYNGDWHKYCFNYENPVYEYLNEEHLSAFSEYLIQRVKELGASSDSPSTILEIGAGNGRLTHFLQQKLDILAPGTVKVIATDSGEWELKHFFPVEKLNHQEAIEKYQPEIIIFSWMPYEMDITDDFRSAKCVAEYIMLGEVDGGCCGNDWLTWGFSHEWSRDENGDLVPSNEELPPYAIDGFTRNDLDDLSHLQICRTDELGAYYHSRTTSFRRK